MMLPSVPKSLGRLSDVFISALGSITGKNNRLALPRARSACVVLVDGLGSANLRYRAGHANFLANQLAVDGSILCGFPSTTVASLVSFSTGTSAGQHGMVGYQVYSRDRGENVNLLTGIGSANEAKHWQSQQTISELAAEQNVACYFIGPAEYRDSGFTHATMRSATYVAARSIEDRVVAAQKILNSKETALVYLYVPELDQKAHAFGSKSGEWVQKLEDLDLAVRQLTKALPANVGVLLTADHGIVDVAADRQVYLDELNIDGLISVGGDPRVLFLYFDTATGDNQLGEQVERLKSFLNKRAHVATRDEIISAGWYGQVSDEAKQRMPDVFLIANGETALYHRDFAKAKSLQMVGQHGAVSDDELFVPLLRFGAYRKNS
jgi:predicted AlkP superfamily pyrophosphatase or phosphodiesterase